MNARPDPDLLIADWLQDEAPDRAPERLLTASRERVRTTNQRRTLWPAWRIPHMNGAFKLAIAAVAVVVVAVVGINLLPRQGGIGGPGPSPTAVPSPTPSPIVNFAGSFAPGTTYAIDDPCCVGSSRLTFTMPATGWSAGDFVLLGKNLPGSSDGFDLVFSPFLVGNVYTGGCNWRGTALVPTLGPTVDDLATALSAQAGPGASPPTAVTVGGHPGKKVELSIPEGLEVTTCDSDGDFPIFGRWTPADDPYAGTGQFSGAAPWTFGNGQHNTVYIVDVNGTRQVIDTMYLPGASAADRAELDQIVASIRFEPRASTPSPSP
jgi:hypothetical protein